MVPPPDACEPTAPLRLHQFTALAPGPRLLVTAAVHGNETCGTQALARLIPALDAGTLRLRRGQLTLLPIANPLAYARGQREGERNLNRQLVPTSTPRCYEDHVANRLCPLFAAHDVLLDLHSFQAEGTPFVMLGPRDNMGPLEPFAHEAAETRLALALGTPRLVEGWLATYARGLARRGAPPEDIVQAIGTTEAMRRAGGYGVTLECGQHADPKAVALAHAAVLRALAVLGMLAPEEAPALPADHAQAALLQMREVVERRHPGDRFARPWRHFDAVHAGETIGWRHDGTPVTAPGEGCLIFPDAGAAVGTDWFYWACPGDRPLQDLACP